MNSVIPIVREDLSITLYTDGSSYSEVASVGTFSTGGKFDLKEYKPHINSLESKSVLFGLMSLCSNFEKLYILLKVEDT